MLERIFFRVQDRPDLLGWKFFPDEVVAAAAIVAASLPGGEGIRQNLIDLRYDLDAILIPAPDHGLNAAACEALLVAAGQDGPGTRAGSIPRTQPKPGKPATSSPRSSSATSTPRTKNSRWSCRPRRAHHAGAHCGHITMRS